MPEEQGLPTYFELSPITGDSSSLPIPTPSSKTLPEWYEFLPSNPESLQNQHKDTSAKMCMPFSDALKTGWVVKAPTTIHIQREHDELVAYTPDKTDDDTPIAVPLTVTQSPQDGNSAFLLPNIRINSQWSISTPEPYSTLVVPPINRTETRFTPLSMFIPTDDALVNLELPIYIEETPITIEKGDILANILPINREALLDEPLIESYSPDSQFGELKNRMYRMNDVRTGFYRNELWTPKTSGATHSSFDEFTETVEASTDDKDTTSPSIVDEYDDQTSRPFIPEEHDYVYYCEEQFEGLVPEPEPAEAVVPDEYATALTSTTDLMNPQPYGEWALEAMNLGYVVKTDRALHLSQNMVGDFHSFNAESDGEQGFHQHLPDKLGSIHPLSPVIILNVFTQWCAVLPHGYSNFYSTPLNHFQRCHESFSGFVDADWHTGEINIPGWFTNQTAQATLERGTPITQGIPINRNTLIEHAVITEQ